MPHLVDRARVIDAAIHLAKEHKVKARLLIFLLIAIGLLVALNWGVAALGPGPIVPGGTLRISSSEPADIDPATASFGNEHRISGQVFEGLVQLDESFVPQPALASGWAYSSDATVFTFTLREAHFSNGRRVVAADVVNSITRALSPTIDSGYPAEYAGMLFDIQGAEAYNHGDTSVAIGVQALNNNTAQFTLRHTVPPDLFLKKLSLWIASIVPLEEVTAGGLQWWRDPAHYVGTGPFKLAEWVAGDHILLVRNPGYYGDVPLDRILVRFIADSSTALTEYQAGRLDVIEPSVAQGSTIANDPLLARDLITAAGTCTSWATLHNQAAPFSGDAGLKLRQAFNHAVDKTAFISATLGGIGVPAKGLIPPSIYGYNPALQGLDFDVTTATQRLAESGYAGNPQIVFYTNPAAPGRYNNLRSQLLNNLGVSIAITTNASVFRQMYVTGWCADYPDPENWLPILLRSDGGSNSTHYNNPAFDALVDQAAQTINETERLALYQQAEQLAISEGALLPLWHNRFAVLKKPWVFGPLAFDWQWNRPFSRVGLGPRVYLPLVIRQ